MTSILPLIPLLLVSVPLSCASVVSKRLNINCRQAIDGLEGKDEFREPKEVPVDCPASLIYSCLDDGKPSFESNHKIEYEIQDNDGAQYLLKLIWHRKIENPDMVNLRNWARAVSQIPEHSGLLNLKKFVIKKADADGNLFEPYGNEASKGIWFMYITLLEKGQKGTFLNLLEDHPELANNFPWIGRTLFKIAQAVKHLHDHNTIHTDINQEAVVFDANFEPKLLISGVPAKKHTVGSFQGYVCSAAPEVLAMDVLSPEERSTFKWSDKQDTYSLGVILFYMLHLDKFLFACKEPNISDIPGSDKAKVEKLFDKKVKKSKRTVYKKIKKGKFEVRSGLPFWVIRVLYWLLQFNELKRWGDDDILRALEHFSTISAVPEPFETPAIGDKMTMDISAVPEPFETPAIGDKLTMDTPINIPKKGNWNRFITIGTQERLKEPNAFQEQDPEVLKSFTTKDPWFLYEPKLDHQFKLVR